MGPTLPEVDEAAFLHAAAGRRVLVLVPGFSCPPSLLVEEGERLRRGLRQCASGAYDCLIGFGWPGGQSFFDYFAAKERIREAGYRLGVWLRRLAARCDAMDVLAHSLGARVLRTALFSERESIRIRNAFLLAAAVSWKAPSGSDCMLWKCARQVWFFHSRRDAALARWYPLVEGTWALGATGPYAPETLLRHKPGNAHIIDLSAEVAHHRDYLQSKVFRAHLTRALASPRQTCSAAF